MAINKEPPKPLQSDYPTAVLLRKEIWERLHIENEHYQAGVFGREGKGKSGTALAIAQMVDPDMSLEQVMFDPGMMMNKISKWKEEGTTKGRMIVADEAGVGLGNRTWFEEDQRNFSQVLQLIRSENMGILFTVPRGVEIDKQIRGGRLHAQIIVRNKHAGDFVESEYENINVSRRVDNDNLWSPKPRMKIDKVTQRINTIRVGPPTDELWQPYVEKKNEFQAEEYEKAADNGGEDEDGKSELKQIADEIRNGRLGDVVGTDGRTGDPRIDRDLIRLHFDISQADATAIKSLLDKEYSMEELEDYV
jgi:hypothetical protein